MFKEQSAQLEERVCEEERPEMMLRIQVVSRVHPARVCGHNPVKQIMNNHSLFWDNENDIIRTVFL